MNLEDKELLKQEIIKYVKQENYVGKRLRSMDIKMISEVAGSFENKKRGIRLLVENEYGLLGNLMFKYMREPEDEIRELISELDEKLIKDAYRSFGSSFVTQGGGRGSFCLRILLKEEPNLIRYVDWLIKDRDLAYEVADFCPGIMEKMHPRFKRNDEFVRQMIKLNPVCLGLADRKYKADREIAYEAVMKKPDTIRYIDYTLRGDEELILYAVKSNGMLLYYADDELKDNYEIVKKAVANNGLALRYASDRLQSDERLLQMAEKYRREMGWQR